MNCFIHLLTSRTIFGTSHIFQKAVVRSTYVYIQISSLQYCCDDTQKCLRGSNDYKYNYVQILGICATKKCGVLHTAKVPIVFTTPLKSNLV